jgi:hypothetical protein
MIIKAKPGFELLHLSVSEHRGFTRDPVDSWETDDDYPCWMPSAHTASMRGYFPDYYISPWHAGCGVLHPDGQVYVHNARYSPDKDRNPCKYYPNIEAWLDAESELFRANHQKFLEFVRAMEKGEP